MNDGNPMPDTGELLVIVCGLPRSGNHLIRDVLRKAGVKAEINHGWPPGLMGYGQRSAEVRLVHPVRDLWVWERAVERTPSCVPMHVGLDFIDHVRRVHSRAIAEAACVWPLIDMSYEAIVRHPEVQFSMLFEWLDLDAEAELPEIYDGNEPYYDN